MVNISTRWPRPAHKHLVAAALALTLGGVAACSGTGDEPDETPGTSQSPAVFDWKQHAGSSITVLTPQNPWQKAIEPLLPEFEELTGIDVDLQALPEEQFRQRRQVVLTGKADAVDAYMSQPVQDGAQFSRAGWYTDLNDFVTDSARTSTDYDFDDFGAGLIDAATVDDALIGIPILVDVEMFYYRTDILGAAGVEPPTTMEQLRTVAAKIDDPDGTRAYASRGRASEAVTQMSIFLYNFGADWTDKDGKAAFDSDEGIEAFTFYGGMLRDFAPAGAVNNSWQELMPLFQQGKIAMWNDSSSFLASIVDPAQTDPTVLDNLGFARMPAGPGGEYNSTLPWMLAISPFSKNTDATWDFVQWATSPEVVTKVQATGVAGARQSIDFPASVPQEWVDIFRYDLTIARPKLPVVIPVAQVRDAIGQAIVTCIDNEQKCADAVHSAADEFDTIVAAAG